MDKNKEKTRFEFENVHVSKERNIYLLKNKISNETLEVILYATILVLLPLVFHVQLIIGILVNAILVKAALDYSLKRIALLSILPSVSALAGGFIFGDLTYALAYMLLFIWVSNFVFAFGIKKLFVENKKNYFISGIVSSAIKSIMLFIVALALFSISLVPELFLTAFGVLQLGTAILGVFVAGLLRLKIKSI